MLQTFWDVLAWSSLTSAMHGHVMSSGTKDNHRYYWQLSGDQEQPPVLYWQTAYRPLQHWSQRLPSVVCSLLIAPDNTDEGPSSCCLQQHNGCLWGFILPAQLKDDVCRWSSAGASLGLWWNYWLTISPLVSVPAGSTAVFLTFCQHRVGYIFHYLRSLVWYLNT